MAWNCLILSLQVIGKVRLENLRLRVSNWGKFILGWVVVVVTVPIANTQIEISSLTLKLDDQLIRVISNLETYLGKLINNSG